MRGVLCRWSVILATLAWIAPGAIVAQEAHVRSANALLPAAASLGSGWVQLSTNSTAELAPAFRDAATAIYGGPAGARVRISVFIVADGPYAARDSWDFANEHFESFWTEINDTDAGTTEQELEARALPAGCAKARRSSGTDQALGERFPVGLTLCAADPDTLFLVYASGEVGGLNGHAASDHLAERALSSRSDDQHGTESGTIAADGDAASADQPSMAIPVGVVSHDIYVDPREITIPANTDVTVISLACLHWILV